MCVCVRVRVCVVYVRVWVRACMHVLCVCICRELGGEGGIVVQLSFFSSKGHSSSVPRLNAFAFACVDTTSAYTLCIPITP